MGNGQLKCYLELTVHWNSYADEFVSDQTGLSEALIKQVRLKCLEPRLDLKCRLHLTVTPVLIVNQVTGHVAVDERGARVFPLTNFPDRRVLDASKGIITKHASSWPMERVLEQRHHVRLVPVGVVSYEHKNQSGSFFVYGLEQKVFFPDYPAKCCCGMCTIL